MLIIQTLSIQKEHIADLLLRAAGLQSIERQLTYDMNEYQPPTVMVLMCHHQESQT